MEENGAAGRALDVDELRSLFSVGDADPSTAGVRDAALLAVLYFTGMRRNEVVTLRIADYDPKEAALNIRGKGNKVRLAFFTDDAQNRLKAWVKLRWQSAGPLFVSVDKGRHTRDGSPERPVDPIHLAKPCTPSKTTAKILGQSNTECWKFMITLKRMISGHPLKKWPMSCYVMVRIRLLQAENTLKIQRFGGPGRIRTYNQQIMSLLL